MLEAIKTRRSIREFDLNKKVSYDDLLSLCKAASFAPSARNQKDKEYIIIDDEKVIEKLVDISKGSAILKNSNTVIAIVGKDPNSLTTPDMEGVDLAAATENILLEATNMHLASCWVGVYPNEERMKKGNEILNIKDNKFLFSLIAIGYPLNDDIFHEIDKFDLNDIHHNKY